MDELIIGEQKYLSSKRAAEITGYAKDYIGQLCREGRVEARLVGRSWYVREAAIKDHRFGAEKAPSDATISEPTKVANPIEDQLQSQKYVTEATSDIFIDPVIEIEHPVDVSKNEVKIEPRADESHNLAEKMQEAWQSWFAETHGNEHKNEEVEPILPHQNDEAVEVHITKVQTATDDNQVDHDREELVAPELSTPDTFKPVYKEESQRFSRVSALSIGVSLIIFILAAIASGILPLPYDSIISKVLAPLQGVIYIDNVRTI